MKKRLQAMVEFHSRLYACKNYFAKPDVVLGSSAYPLSPLLAIKLAGEYRCRSICEIRDLWPLSLEEYGIIKRGGAIAKAMYRLEHKLYREADAVVFTMPGGSQYLRDRKWDCGSGGDVDLGKVFNVNNGVDLDEYHRNLELFHYRDNRFSLSQARKVVYTGSIRRVNNVGFLVDTAKLLEDSGVEFYLFGEGEERAQLEERCRVEGIVNVFFMGKIDKRFVPSVISQGSMVAMGSSFAYGVLRYGGSPNKLFDYLAAGKPIISGLPFEYSIVNSNDCGIERRFDTPEACASCILEMLDDPAAMRRWSKNAINAAQQFSFKNLTNKLIEIIEG